MVRVSIIATRASDIPSGADNHSTLPKASLIQQPTTALRTCPPVASMIALSTSSNTTYSSEAHVRASAYLAGYTSTSPSLDEYQHTKHHQEQSYPG